MKVTDREKNRIRHLSALLREAERPVRLMRALLWPSSVRTHFFARGARELPVVDYPAFDPLPVLKELKRARRLAAGDSVVDQYFQRLADGIESGALMLATLGTPEFLEHSRRVYGSPAEPLPDQTTTPLQLAVKFKDIVDKLTRTSLSTAAEEDFPAEQAAAELREAVVRTFGDRAPRVQLVKHLASKALAGSERIRLNKKVRFTKKEIIQLIQHEAFIHIATSLNGRSQPDLTILGASHPGTTRTQEGLAVFAEFVTGAMDLHRLRRLADRVFAIQQAISGADFLDVYRYFLDRTDHPHAAFEGTQRVFRGGVLTGGAPLTKDSVYLGGLLRVQNFLSAALSHARPDILRLLFCGKLDLDDIPALARMAKMGLLRAPDFLPPWAADPGCLLSHLALSSFLNTVNLKKVAERCEEMLISAPVVDFPSPAAAGR